MSFRIYNNIYIIEMKNSKYYVLPFYYYYFFLFFFCMWIIQSLFRVEAEGDSFN